ncbi:MAG: YqiA/YcfP family alpha/beta fold hydrolase [Burkholderiaceae bacterium]
MIVYLHGFRSSPHSFKACVIAERMKQLGRSSEYYCPQLPASPRQAIQLASSIVQQSAADQITLIGSSLGGYYATWLAEQFGRRAVLLNPAIKPPRDLQQYVGVMTAFHSDEPFEFKREYIDELKEFSVDRITRAERYFLIAATGDEILDWHEMTAHYEGAQQRVIDGSDHALSDFENYVDDVLAFCGIKVESRR